MGRHDPVTQRLDESHVSLSGEGVRLNPIVSRYAWAERARSHGANRRAAAEGALGRMEPRTLQLHQQQTRVRLRTLSQVRAQGDAGCCRHVAVTGGHCSAASDDQELAVSRTDRLPLPPAVPPFDAAAAWRRLGDGVPPGEELTDAAIVALAGPLSWCKDRCRSEKGY